MAEKFTNYQPFMGVGIKEEEDTKAAQIYPKYEFFDIRGAEIAELKDKVNEFEKRLERVFQVIPIQFLESEGLRLIKPLFINLSYYLDDKIYIVDSLELNVYGSGKDEQLAVDDFKLAIKELYFSLKEDKDKLGPDLKKKWDILSKIVRDI